MQGWSWQKANGRLGVDALRMVGTAVSCTVNLNAQTPHLAQIRGWANYPMR